MALKIIAAILLINGLVFVSLYSRPYNVDRAAWCRLFLKWVLK